MFVHYFYFCVLVFLYSCIQPEFDEAKALQECNWQVVNCSTPANFFHVLRRQVKRDYRKPLIIATPKSLLKSRQCVSNIEDFTEGSKFHRVISGHTNSYQVLPGPTRLSFCVSDDGLLNRYQDNSPSLEDGSKIRKVVFCSGQVYYEFYKHREEREIKDIALVRLEQISPFPYDRIEQELKKYPNVCSLLI